MQPYHAATPQLRRSLPANMLRAIKLNREQRHRMMRDGKIPVTLSKRVRGAREMGMST